MKITDSISSNQYTDLVKKLKIDCEKCSGLCCVALYCAKSEGFPADKESGKPCRNLMPDFRCSIHSKLVQCKMKGCLAYDCFGAGQEVTQSYQNYNWKTNDKKKNEIFKVFLIVFQLHQMLWYLIEASTIAVDSQVKSDIDALILANEQMTARRPEEILTLDIETYRNKANTVLKKVSNTIAKPSANNQSQKDFIGKNFKRANLNGQDFSMAFMIASNLEGCSLEKTNFLGADMRDANIKNTDLSNSIFLTQMQINSAMGNSKTKLPVNLVKPVSWY